MIIRTAAKWLFAGLDRLIPHARGPRVLIYHQVGSGLGRQMEVETDDFARQLDWLMVHREVVDLDTAIERWDEPGSENLVVLTFDDGYLDTWTTAFPLLAERRLPFTLYLTTAPIESGEPLDLAAPIRWEHVGEMLGSGLVTVGAHTHTHPDLRSLDRAAVEHEVVTSNQLIRDRLGVEPVHFTYPWGYWSEVAEGVLADHYASVTIAAPRTIEVPADRLRLPRVPIQLSDGFRFFPARLGGGLRAEELVRRRLRGYTGP